MSVTQPAEKYFTFLAMGGKFTGKNIADANIGANHLNTKVLTGTSHGTPGTGVNVAHGLGATPTVLFVRKGNAFIDAVDGTNVTVKSTVASAPFEIVIVQ